MNVCTEIGNMKLRTKIAVLISCAKMLTYDPLGYATALNEVGDAINLFGAARRYILAQIKLSLAHQEPSTLRQFLEMFEQWASGLSDLSMLETQICQEIVDTKLRLNG